MSYNSSFLTPQASMICPSDDNVFQLRGGWRDGKDLRVSKPNIVKKNIVWTIRDFLWCLKMARKKLLVNNTERIAFTTISTSNENTNTSTNNSLLSPDGVPYTQYYNNHSNTAHNSHAGSPSSPTSPPLPPPTCCVSLTCSIKDNSIYVEIYVNTSVHGSVVKFNLSILSPIGNQIYKRSVEYQKLINYTGRFDIPDFISTSDHSTLEQAVETYLCGDSLCMEFEFELFSGVSETSAATAYSRGSYCNGINSSISTISSSRVGKHYLVESAINFCRSHNTFDNRNNENNGSNNDKNSFGSNSSNDNNKSISEDGDCEPASTDDINSVGITHCDDDRLGTASLCVCKNENNANVDHTPTSLRKSCCSCHALPFLLVYNNQSIDSSNSCSNKGGSDGSVSSISYRGLSFFHDVTKHMERDIIIVCKNEDSWVSAGSSNTSCISSNCSNSNDGSTGNTNYNGSKIGNNNGSISTSSTSNSSIYRSSSITNTSRTRNDNLVCSSNNSIGSSDTVNNSNMDHSSSRNSDTNSKSSCSNSNSPTTTSSIRLLTSISSNDDSITKSYGNNNTNTTEGIRASRHLLAARSPVFRAALNGWFEESRSQKFIINDFSYTVMRNFVQFVDTDMCDLIEDYDSNFNDLLNLLKAAHKYNFRALEATCAICVQYRLSPKTALPTLSVATLTKNTVLTQAAMRCLDNMSGKTLYLAVNDVGDAECKEPDEGRINNRT